MADAENCAQRMAELGQARPRTCTVCGLGPCYFQSPIYDSTLLDKVPEHIREMGRLVSVFFAKNFPGDWAFGGLMNRRDDAPSRRDWDDLCDKYRKSNKKLMDLGYAVQSGTGDYIRPFGPLPGDAISVGHKLHDHVRLTELDVSARIVAIYEADSGKQFKVRYFHNGDEKLVCVYADELTPEKTK